MSSHEMRLPAGVSKQGSADGKAVAEDVPMGALQASVQSCRAWQTLSQEVQKAGARSATTFGLLK